MRSIRSAWPAAVVAAALAVTLPACGDDDAEQKLNDAAGDVEREAKDAGDDIKREGEQLGEDAKREADEATE